MVLKHLAAVFVALGLMTACAPLEVLNVVSGGGAHRVDHGVEYGSPYIENRAERQALNHHRRRRLDIYYPSGTAPVDGWPMVIFFYGGTWRSGERGDYAFVGHALAAQGVMTLIADYRLYPEVRFPEFLRDSASAAVWGMDAASRLGANPARVFLMGHSAGAYNAAMLALDPQWLREAGAPPTGLAGWIGLAGPYDFLPIENPDAKPVFFHPHYPAGTQPIEFTSTSFVPAFLAAGEKDHVADPTRNTMQLARALSRHHPPVQVQIYPGRGHASLVVAFSAPFRWTASVLKDVSTFIHSSEAAHPSN